MINMNEWQPIATAPKDGTHILAFIPGGDGYPSLIYVLNWRRVPYNTAIHGEWHWVEAAGEEYEWFEPTHWMPLPNPPR